MVVSVAGVIATASVLASARPALAQAQAGAATRLRFDADQAKRGVALFDKSCGTCHDGGTMGPELWGGKFVSDWARKDARALYERIRTTMPENAPGSLSETEVLDVLAFVLRENGHEAGGAPLTSAGQLENVRVGGQ